MRKYLIIPSFIFFLLGCSSNDESTNEIPQENDTTNPEISINGIENGDTVETITSLNVSIMDEDNQITTTILVDNQEISTNENKQFTIDIDPFDFSSGAKTLTIESTDSSGNTTTLTQSFEMKKLLFINSDFQIPLLFSNPELETYISINTMEGELLDYQKIEADQETRFYAPNMVERQNIIATMFMFYPNSQNRQPAIISYGNLLPGTKTITQNEVALRRLEYSKSNSFQLTMTDATETTNFKMKGQEYSLETFGATTGNFAAPINYDPNLNGRMFIYSNPSGADNLQDYRFLFIDDFVDSTISFTDFDVPNNSTSIQFPQSITDFGLTLFGYRSQDDYDKRKYTEIFTKPTSITSTSTNIEVPILEEFEIYEKQYGTKLSEKKSYLSRTKGFGEITIPDWDAQLEGNLIITSGNYDHLFVGTTFKGDIVENTVNRITWSYSEKNNPEVILPFQNFEIPQEIKTMLESLGIDPNNPSQLEMLSVILEDFEKDNAFEDGIFVGYGNSNYYGDEQSMSFRIKDGINN